MKKLLLSMVAVAASTMVANADKAAFVVQGINYTGDATQIVTVPTGYTGSTTALTCDALMISEFTNASNQPYVSTQAFRWYDKAETKLTPAKGVTINKITIYCQQSQETTYANALTDDFTIDETNKFLQSSTKSFSEEITITPATQFRFSIMEIEYTGTPVKMPVVSADYDYVLPLDKKVTLTAEAGAKIYYTLDGTVPTEASTLYTEPFALTQSSYVRAIAVTDAGTSFPVTKAYISVPAPAGVQIAKYDFTNVPSLTAAGHNLVDEFVVDGTDGNKKVETDGIVYTADKTSFEAAKSTGSMPRLFFSATLGNSNQMRTYASNLITYKVTDEDYYIAAIVHVGSYNNSLIVNGSTVKKTFTASEDENGTLNYETVLRCLNNKGTSATATWLPKDGVKTNAVTLTHYSGAKTQYIDQVYIVYAPKDASGIEGVAVDNSNAPVEYFNLQGVRVANPANGIYVKRQGNTATKVLVK